MTDSSGAVVVDATVTATNLDTGAHRRALTNQSGQYLVFPLEPGRYDITVTKPSFGTVSLRDLAFDVNDNTLRDFQLPVGGSAAEVTVSASSAPLLTQEISTQNVVTQQQLNALPLNGRDFNQLVLLSAGATDNTVATSVNLDF